MNAQPESSWGLAVSCLSCKSKVNTAGMSGQQTYRNTPSKEQPKHSEPPPPPKALPCPRSDVCPHHRHPPHAPPCRRWCAGRASKQPCPNPGFSYCSQRFLALQLLAFALRQRSPCGSAAAPRRSLRSCLQSLTEHQRPVYRSLQPPHVLAHVLAPEATVSNLKRSPKKHTS